jgi:Fe-S cluster assembly protein SufD
MTALPTRKLEAYRYADIDALRDVWDGLAQPERVEVAAQQRLQQIWLPNGDGVEVRRVEMTLQAGAAARIFALNNASRYGRIELDVILHEGADFKFDAANIGGDSSTLEIVTTIRHIETNATSRQTVRSVLGGKAVGSYLGKVEVARGAQQTDGEQSLRGLLLQRSATVNLKPELEIFADDVKGAHGATVGELDRMAMFYLQSRGIEEGRAKALLTRAFVADAMARIGEDAVRDAFAADAGKWLEAAL